MLQDKRGLGFGVGADVRSAEEPYLGSGGPSLETG